jgi:hypothetical protein
MVKSTAKKSSPPRAVVTYGPDSKFAAHLKQLKKVRSRIEALRSEQATILDELPCGFYWTGQERLAIRMVVSSNVSIKILRRFVSEHLIRMATTKSRPRKAVIKAPSKEYPLTNQESLP